MAVFWIFLMSIVPCCMLKILFISVITPTSVSVVAAEFSLGNWHRLLRNLLENDIAKLHVESVVPLDEFLVPDKALCHDANIRLQE